MSATLEQAIQSMDSATAALIAARQDLEGKNAAIDAAVAAQQAAFEAWKSGHIDEHSALCVNKNASMLAVAGTAPQQLPVDLGIHAGGGFWDKFSVEFISVASNCDPQTRAPVARELLQFMGMDRLHFSAAFNIMKLTVRSIAAGFGPYVFHIPNQHVKMGCFMSYVGYHKMIGSADWSWCDNTIKGRWAQITWHSYNGGNDAGAYTHIDYAVTGNVAVGDTLYLALPQIIVGKWNPDHRCPQLYNVGAGLGT